jgi:ferredoxin-NADP reductase
VTKRVISTMQRAKCNVLLDTVRSAANTGPRMTRAPVVVAAESRSPWLAWSGLGRRIEERIVQTRRDLSMIAGALRGANTPYLVPRRDGAARAKLGTRRMRVADVRRESPSSITLVLEGLSGPALEFAAGQFLTLEVEVEGERRRRAYSFSSAPHEGAISVTVKEIEGGAVSSHLHRTLGKGDEVHVLGPSGSFVLPDEDRPIVFFGGGSGITPIRSLLCSMLHARTSPAHLVYANRRAGDVIFGAELDRLATDPRFSIRHVLEAAEGRDALVGRLDRENVDRALAEVPFPLDANVLYYLCGPEPMRRSVSTRLRERGVAPSRIREEVYFRPMAKAGMRIDRMLAHVSVRRDGRVENVRVLPTDTILEASVRDGIPLPFSCSVGGCGACRVKLVSGVVTMDEPNCLTEDERREGYVLTCVGRPETGCVLEVQP